MQTITIEKVFEPKTFGDFTSVSVFTKEFPNVYISGSYDLAKEWKKGDVVEVVITEKEKNGKIYKNFSAPKKVNIVEDRVAKLEKGFETFRKEMEMKFAELKSDLVLQTTGKFSLDKDYKKAEETNYIPEPEF